MKSIGAYRFIAFLSWTLLPLFSAHAQGNAGFLRRLDDRMCPEASSKPPEHCRGDFRIARSVLVESGFSEEEHFDVLHVLMAQGGYCDCEILYNAAPESRLRARYWSARAQRHDKGPVA